MHRQDGPGHDASQGLSAARRFGKQAEDVEDVRLRSRLYSATSRSAVLTYQSLPEIVKDALLTGRQLDNEWPILTDMQNLEPPADFLPSTSENSVYGFTAKSRTAGGLFTVHQ